MLIFLCGQAHGRSSISTYLEGNVVQRTHREMVFRSLDGGVYWISLSYPPSWVRKNASGQMSFWIPVRQIRKIQLAAS